jgi:hypothetical protein
MWRRTETVRSLASSGISDGLKRLALSPAVHYEFSADWLGRVRLRLITDPLPHRLPSGQTWFARWCWEGFADDAVARLAGIADGGGWPAFQLTFNEAGTRAHSWPEGWQEALEAVSGESNAGGETAGDSA